MLWLATSRSRFNRRNFWQCSSGAPAIEFILALPIALMLYVGTFEVSQLIIADRKVAHAASTIADLTSREESIGADRLRLFARVAAMTIAPEPSSSLMVGVATAIRSEGSQPEYCWGRSYRVATGTISEHHPEGEVLLSDVGNYPENIPIVITEISYVFTFRTTMLSSLSIPLSRTAYSFPVDQQNIKYDGIGC